jgi:N-methylhydantoinase A
VPSTPSAQADGVLAAIEVLLLGAGARPAQIRRFAHGMTVATNALLEGTAARTALLATEGFTDIVELGRQARPSLYRLCQAPPPPLVPSELRFGVAERMGPDGPLRELHDDDAQALIAALQRAQPESVAVVLLHSYAHPQHEILIGRLISQHLPDVHCSLSHELVGTFREYERAATTEVDAALSPLLESYLSRLSERVSDAGLPEPRVMQSSGGLSDCAHAAAHAALTVLSGPAGGVAGALMLAELAGEPDVLCLDMGGTSCDVCLIENSQVAETAERVVAGRTLALPMLDIHTVGAGGGSIAWRDAGGALCVGPQSAGARPGPACYGLGGEQPTVTDANLLLGRLLCDSPIAADIELDRHASERVIAELGAQLGMSPERCAEGILRVAEAQMLGALRVMSVQRGLDPRRFALMAFGGAGPLHAAALAGELGIEHVLCPRASGVLCALGLAAATPRRDTARTVMLSGQDLTAERIARECGALIDRACRDLAQEPRRTRVRYELRYRGQSFELPIECDPGAGEPSTDPRLLRESFHEIHEQRYGYREPDTEIELVTIRVSVWGEGHRVQLGAEEHAAPERQTANVVFDGQTLQAEFLRGEPGVGTQISGPAVCAMTQTTLLVPPGWSATVDEHGTTHLRVKR